jgi:teichuronic acid exporter
MWTPAGARVVCPDRSQEKDESMLKQQAVAATMWSGADILLRQGLQFGVSIALARMLSPSEFGTIALLYLFTGLAGAFIDSGFSNALIQNQDISHDDESTVFWFNAALGALAALLLWGVAPSISRFYGIPILVPLTHILALNVFISALGSIHETLLTKRLNFRKQMTVGAIATGVSGVLAVGLAFHGFGVWSLAAQIVTSTSLTTVLLWVVNPWRPGFVFRLASARKLFGFGSYLLMAAVLDVSYNRLYTVFIGKLYGVRDLGFYNRADGTRQLPTGLLSGVLSRVAFPIFSAAAHDKKRLRRGVRHAIRGIMLINVPMMLGLMATAEPLIRTLYGPKWLPAVPALRVLCLAGMLWPLHVINLSVLTAQGHSHLFFRLEIAKKVVGVILLIVGARYGVMGIAWSQVAFGLLGFFMNAHYTGSLLDYSGWQQTLDFAPVVGASAVMSMIVAAIGIVWRGPVALELLLQIAIGTSIFVAICVICRLEAFQEGRLMAVQRFETVRLARGAL